MKALILPLIGLAVGIGIGLSNASSELDGATEEFTVLSEVTTHETVEGPRIQIVGGSYYDFGSMERFGKRSHVFEIKNIGTEPLTLQQQETTCKCTLSKFEKSKILPGETMDVTLSWTAAEVGPQGEFEQSATITSNDAVLPVFRLTIKGKIRQSVLPFPKRLSLGNVLKGEGRDEQFELVTFRKTADGGPLKVLKLEFANPASSSYFEASTEVLTPDRLKEHDRALEGVLVRIRVKSGLPYGRINQTIRLTVNLPDSPVVEVPLDAMIAPELQVLGIGTALKDGEQISLGDVDASKGAIAKLMVIVKGQHRSTMKFETKEIEPSFLKATVGEGTETNNGNAVRYPVEISIPAGSPEEDRSTPVKAKQGRVVIGTNHPTHPTIKLFVQFRTGKEKAGSATAKSAQ